MVILLRKRDLLISGFFCCFFLCLAAVFWHGHKTAVPVFSSGNGAREPVIVVIDPGHGGEDGGAVSPGGVKESDLNLAVSLRLNDLLRFAGQPTMMTRREDVSICEEGLESVRQRKMSDLKNRVSLVNGLEPSVMISIHQNSLPSSTVTHGAQAFCNRQEEAGALAEFIQDALNQGINNGNEKKPRQIPEEIYLMKNITAPGVLVECGFLSNVQETEQLQTPFYQLRLASAIAAGYLCWSCGDK